MEERLKDFLQSHFSGMHVRLNTMSSGRIAGQVIWDGFDKRDQVARQEIIRKALKKHFGPDVQFISVLLTYTPDEMRSMAAA